MLRALVLGVAVIGSACGSSGFADDSGAEALGPLAVIESRGTGKTDAIGGTGPVSIGKRCVTITVGTPPRQLLLIWRSAEVRWNDDQEITFLSRAVADPKAVTIRDGDNITIEGEYFESEGGTKRDVDWVAEPHDSCIGDLFIVDFVTAQNP